MNNSDLINSFVEHLKDKDKTSSTIIAYSKDIEQISESNPSKLLTQFTPDDIKYALNYLHTNKSLSLKTISRKVNSIRTFYKFLETKGLTKNNPALSIAHPKYKIKKPRVLSRSEYLALKEVSRQNERLFMMIELLLQTGIRISELSRLNKSEVFLNNKHPYILIKAYSSNSERKIPLTPRMASQINIYMLSNTNKSDALFCTKSGKCIEVRNIRSSIDRAIIKAQIKNACVNDLRNTFIVYQLANGISVSKLSEIVGHRNSATTMKYLSLLEKRYKPSGIDELTDL